MRVRDRQREIETEWEGGRKGAREAERGEKEQLVKSEGSLSAAAEIPKLSSSTELQKSGDNKTPLPHHRQPAMGCCPQQCALKTLQQLSRRPYGFEFD